MPTSLGMVIKTTPNRFAWPQVEMRQNQNKFLWIPLGRLPQIRASQRRTVNLEGVEGQKWAFFDKTKCKSTVVLKKKPRYSHCLSHVTTTSSTPFGIIPLSECFFLWSSRNVVRNHTCSSTAGTCCFTAALLVLFEFWLWQFFCRGAVFPALLRSIGIWFLWCKRGNCL